MVKRIDTGGLPFPRLIDGGYYFVDKSMLIADMLGNNPRGVYLYTRPRRFGKTTNISMLDAFLNMEYQGNTWFDDLDISKHHEFDQYRNAFPVIRMDLKDASTWSWDEFLDSFNFIIQRSMLPYDGVIQESEVLIPGERRLFSKIYEQTANENELMSVLSFLCSVLHRHYGRRAVVLIDEYDHAITDTFGKDIQSDVMRFIGGFMSATLKGNHSLQMGYVTGITNVVFGDMFGGLNNIWVDNVFSTESDERFGFTEAEVRRLLEHYGHPESFDDVWDWYGGYRFGDAEVCSPFGVTRYVDGGFEPRSYWADSSGVNPLWWMMERAKTDDANETACIVTGGSADVMVRTEAVLKDLSELRGNELYSLMVVTGYLRAVPNGDGLCSVSIPNRDVMGTVDRFFQRSDLIGTRLKKSFFEAVSAGDAERIAASLQDIFSGGNRFDLREGGSCVLVVLTLIHGISTYYDVALDAGIPHRNDIVLKPKIEGAPTVIITLKASDSETGLERDADAAMSQIQERCSDVRGDVLLAGIAYHGRDSRIRTRIVHQG